jgi:hypothetical protein
MDLAVNNPYGAINARNFGYPNHNSKSSYSPSNMIFNNGESIWGQTNRDDREGDYDFINFLSKQVKIKDFISQLMPPEAYSQQFNHPSTLGQFVQRSTLGQFVQRSTLGQFVQRSTLGQFVQRSAKSFQLISLRESICDKCLTIDTIPIFLYEDGTVKEIHNHSCSEDRVLDLKQKDKYYLSILFVALYGVLPKILAINVAMCNKSQAKISLCFKKCDGSDGSGSSNCPIRVLDAFPSEHRWINQIKNSQKRKDIIELETAEELLSFLEISINSTMIKLKIKRDSSLSPLSENWDSYLVGLNLPEHNIKKVNEPFIPKFPN